MSPAGARAPSAGGSSRRWRTAWAIATIFLVTISAYFPVLKAGFIWDDDGFVTRPGLRSLRGLWRIWSEAGATEQYYPVLHSSFWLEHRLWGDAAPGYHLLNVLLHATAACLFALVLRRLALPGAWLAALVLALHPVCVESVAWVTEQKNTLSTVFYLWAGLVYLGWSDDRRKGRAHYGLATMLFVLAVLTKSATVTLPAALLVVTWWRRGRLAWREDVMPLLPWFGLSAAAGVVTWWVERTFIGAQGAAFALTLTQRWLLAGRQVWFYLGKLAWPANLIFIYPRWRVDASMWWPYLFPLGVLFATAVLWLMRRRTRAPLAAWLLFVGSLFPTLGFLNVYAFIYSYVADHWQYLAILGPIALVTAGPCSLAAAGKFRGIVAPLAAVVAAGVLCVLGVLTWRQCGLYRNMEVFYSRTLERNPDCWMAHNNLGVLLANTGRLDEAVEHYREALRLNGGLPETCNDLGIALAREGRLPEAIQNYEQALRLRRDFPEAHNNLGTALANTGRLDEAIAHFREAVRIKPDYVEARHNLAEAHYELGNASARSGRLEEAVAQFQEALRLRPNFAAAYANLGYVFAQGGRLEEAAAQFQEALRLDGHNAGVHYQLGLVLRKLGRGEEAQSHFEAAERLGAAR